MNWSRSGQVDYVNDRPMVAEETSTVAMFRNEYAARRTEPAAKSGGESSTGPERTESAKQSSTPNLELTREGDKAEFLKGWAKLDDAAKEKAEKWFDGLKPDEKTAILDYTKAQKDNPIRDGEGRFEYNKRLAKEGVKDVDKAFKILVKMFMGIAMMPPGRYSKEQLKDAFGY